MRNFKINFNRYFLNTFESTLERGIHDSINSRIFQPFADTRCRRKFCKKGCGLEFRRKALAPFSSYHAETLLSFFA